MVSVYHKRIDKNTMHLSSSEQREFPFLRERERQEQQVRAYAQEYFHHHLVDDPFHVDRFETLQRVRNSLADLTDSTQEWRDLTITHGMQKGAEYFFDEMISFLKDIRKNRDTRHLAQTKAAQIEQQLFQVSPSIDELLPFDKKLKTAATFSRVPEAADMLVPRLIGEIGYDISFMDQRGIEQLATMFPTLPVHEQLAMLRIYEQAGNRTAFEGEWATTGFNRSLSLVGSAYNETQYSVVRLLAGSIGTRLDQVADEAYGDDIWNDPEEIEAEVASARNREEQKRASIRREDIAVREALGPEREQEKGIYFSQISSDYIGKLNRNTGAVKELAKLGPNDSISREDEGPSSIEVQKLYARINDSVELERHATDSPDIESAKGRRFFEDIEQMYVYHRDRAGSGSTVSEILALLDPEHAELLQEFHETRVTSNELKNEAQQEYEQMLETYHEGELSNEEVKSKVKQLQSFYGPQVDAAEIAVKNTFDALYAQRESMRMSWMDQLSSDLTKESTIDSTPDFVDLEAVLDDPTVLPFQQIGMQEDEAILFEQMHHPDIRFALEDALGINLRDISLRDQIHLLRYMSTADDSMIDRCVDIKKRGDLDLKQVYSTFFACAESKEIGHTLLDFAASAPKQEVHDICSQYNALTERIKKIEETIEDFFSHASGKTVDARLAIQKMLERANKALLQSIEATSQGKQLTFTDIEADIIEFSSLFQTVFKGNKEVTFDEVRGLDYESIQSELLSDTDKQMMISIVEANWIPRGETGKIIVDQFKSSLDSKNSGHFYMLKKNNEMISFIKYDDMKAEESPDDRMHKRVGSFNVHPKYRGSAIGEAVLERSLDKEAKGAVLHASVSPDLIVGTDYVEKRGFVISGILPDFAGSTDAFFEIMRDDELLKRSITRDPAIDPATYLQDHQQSDSNETVVVAGDLSIASRKKHFIDQIGQYTRQGYLGTRYTADPTNPDKRYILCERIPDKQR